MTQPTRTIAQIDAAITSVNEMINNVDAFLQDLRNEPAKNVWVVGFPQYGLYVHPKGGIGSVLSTRLLDLPAATALAPRVTNGKGEVAVAIDYERAIDMVISTQEDLHTWLCGQLRDLHEERVDARRDADEAADAAARAYEAEQDYYGMVAERARHP